MDTSLIAQLVFSLGLRAVVTMEKAHGDRVAGADKRTLAKDWLQGIAGGAISVLPGDKAAMAQEAADVADEAIDLGFLLAKKSGELAKAKAAAHAATATLAPPNEATLQNPLRGTSTTEAPITEDPHGIAG